MLNKLTAANFHVTSEGDAILEILQNNFYLAILYGLTK